MARYILNLRGRYVQPDLRGDNPAHMLNDAGPQHANAACKEGGEVRAKTAISMGQELFWCYGALYWKYWKEKGGKLTLSSANERRGC